jgi:hypothetical protein
MIQHDLHDAPDVVYLLCLWVVVWSACVVVSLLGETEANWSAPAHVALVVLMSWWLAPRGFAGGRLRRVAWPYVVLWASGLVVMSAVQHTEWFYAPLARFFPAPTASKPAPMRRYDPTSRMRGYRELASGLAERLVTLRATGTDPFVLTPIYSLASTLTFHLPGQPEVYCLAWSPGWVAEAVNQHDLWHPNPRHDLGAFRGRSALVVEDANSPPSYALGLVKHGVFESVGQTSRVVVRRHGVIVGVWDVTLCHGYRGPQNVEENRRLFRTYASAAYVAAHGKTARGYVSALYRDLRHRAPTPQEEAVCISILRALPRELVVLRVAYDRKDYTQRVLD